LLHIVPNSELLRLVLLGIAEGESKVLQGSELDHDDVMRLIEGMREHLLFLWCAKFEASKVGDVLGLLSYS
jgi:hypothetical protein